LIAALPLLACARTAPTRGEMEMACTSLRSEDGFASTVQPTFVAIDEARGRGVATGLALANVSVFDLDAGVRTGAIPYAAPSTEDPRVVMDAAGVAWVGSASSPGLVRVDLDRGEATAVPGVEAVSLLLPTAAGVVYAGSPDAEEPALVRLDGDGNVAATANVGPYRGGAAHPDGLVVLDGTLARVLDADTLEEISTCYLGITAVWVAALDDGTLASSDGEQLARSDCAGEVGVWSGPLEVRGMVTDGVTAWAIDRVGPDDPTRGVAWRIAAAGEPELAFVTGKNTAHGQVDRGTGRLWANSEGSGEVMAWDLATGDEEAVISVGSSVDGLVVTGEGEVLATGRLSDLVATVSGGAPTRVDGVRWPWMPVLDADRGRVWTVDHLDGLLVGLDAATAEVRDAFDLGLGPNTLLTFDSLALAHDRGTLLVADSESDVLLELAPDSGATVASWDLGGPAVEDPDQGGQLELLYREGTAWLARTNDGRVQRLDLGTGQRTDAWLSDDELGVLMSRRITRAMVFDGQDVVLGPLRVDAETLAVTGVLDIAALLTPLADGDWLALDIGGASLVRLDADGARVAERKWMDESEPGVLAAVDGSNVWITRPWEGMVCRVPLEEVGG
jgi:hypothetical protein